MSATVWYDPSTGKLKLTLDLAVSLSQSPILSDTGSSSWVRPRQECKASEPKQHPVLNTCHQGTANEMRTAVAATTDPAATEQRNDLFDATICHPRSQARVRGALDSPLGILKAAWTPKVSRYARMMQTGGKTCNCYKSGCLHWVGGT